MKSRIGSMLNIRYIYNRKVQGRTGHIIAEGKPGHLGKPALLITELRMPLPQSRLEPTPDQ